MVVPPFYNGRSIGGLLLIAYADRIGVRGQALRLCELNDILLCLHQGVLRIIDEAGLLDEAVHRKRGEKARRPAGGSTWFGPAK